VKRFLSKCGVKSTITILSDLDNNDLPNEHKENKTSAPLTVSVNGQRGCLFVICFASGAVSESAFAAKSEYLVSGSTIFQISKIAYMPT
jgi:hypothetical protein